MRLNEFLPELAGQNAQLVQSNKLLKTMYDNGFMSFVKSRYGESGIKSAVEYYGIEQLYFDWLRTAYAYRRMFIQDLYLLAFDSTEIRTPLLHLKNEVFRKGFDEWKPKFALKCLRCGKEFKEKIERCDCGSSDFREPEKEQYERFDEFRKSCNIFNQSLEEILQTLADDLNICLVPETLIYRIDSEKGQGYQRIDTIKVNDHVYTHLGHVRKVLKVYQRLIDEELVVLYLDNNEIIKITTNHPIYTKRGWIKAGELTINDILYKLSDIKKYSTKIININKEHYSGFVYNLEVEEDNSYCGKGIIFHNCDDAYLFLNSQYTWVKNKLWSKVVELRRIHPALMEFDLDKEGLPKNSHWLCPFHRENVSVKPVKCNECDIDMRPVMYVYNHRGKRIYLFEDEIIHLSKFSPSETYGYSVLLTVMQKILTISGMDRFLYRYFFERKAPTGMILTYTDDPQSLEVERARIEAKMMEDPTYMPWVAVSQRTGRGRTDFVRLFHTLQEMDYLNVRNEIRDRIAAIYGVPQMYMNVMEGIGGISGQTQQLKVFSNVIAADQRKYNEKVFPILLQNFGITDWEITLRPPEEKVEAVIIQQAQQKVSIASQMRAMGFTVELKPEAETIDKLDFTFSGKAQELTGGMGIPMGGYLSESEIGEGEEPSIERKQPQEEKVFDSSYEDKVFSE